MPDVNLEYNQIHKIGDLSDGSIICIKRTFTQSEGEYQIIRRMKGGTDFTDMVLEDGYINFSPAAERAWSFFIMLNK